ncbi:hypothetical protein D3C85_887610 [compost metagenome]
MAEPDDLELRIVLSDDGVDIVEEGRHLADGHRDVVLVRRPVADGFRDVFAQLPQVLQLLLALAHHPVEHPALLDAMLEGGQGRFGHRLAGRLELQQRIERALGVERRRHVAAGHDLGQGLVGEELEGGQVQLVLEGVQHRHDRIEIGRAEDHGGEVLRRAIQAHGGLDHEAQGAFGADEQLAQVVAGGVLDQVAVQLEDLALAGDHLEAGDPVAGHAVADHLDATGVGADVAADLAGACRGEVHRVVEALLLGEVLQLLGDHAGLAARGAVEGVEVENLVHVVEGHDHFAVGGDGGGGQAGTAARGYQGDLALIGPAHDGLHFLDGLREDDGQRIGLELLGPVLAEGVQGRGIGEHLAGFDQGLQFIDQGSLGHLRKSRPVHGHPEQASCSGMGASRGRYVSICTPPIAPAADSRVGQPALSTAQPISPGQQVYADEQDDLSRQEQDQVPSSRRCPPERRGHPEGRWLHQHRVPEGRAVG